MPKPWEYTGPALLTGVMLYVTVEVFNKGVHKGLTCISHHISSYSDIFLTQTFL